MNAMDIGMGMGLVSGVGGGGMNPPAGIPGNDGMSLVSSDSGMGGSTEGSGRGTPNSGVGTPVMIKEESSRPGTGAGLVMSQ